MAVGAALMGCDATKTVPEQRVLVPVTWNRVWTAGGTEADTTLLQPWRLAVGRELVFVADKAGHRIAAFRLSDGGLAWIRGRRGRGPGEFQLPTALAVDRGGRLWVADARTSRMTLYRPDGSLDASLTLSEFPYPEALCPLEDGSMLVATSAPAEPLFRLSVTGEVIDRMNLPWRDLADAPPLSVQKLLAPTADGCVLALSLGRGFAVLTERGGRTHPYVENLPLPEVEQTVADGGATVTQRVVDMRTAATSVAAHGDEIAISPGGSGALENRLVDFYRRSDGTYLRSVSTPAPFQRMARAGDVFLFLTHGDGYPALVAVRPEFGPDTAAAPR